MKMAAELKLNDRNNISDKNTNKNNFPLQSVNNIVELYTFQLSDIVIYSISIVLFVLNIVTDILIIVQCYLHSYTSWMFTLLSFLIIPLIITQIISSRLYQKDGFDISSWIIRLLCFGVLERYVVLLKAAIQGTKNGTQKKTKESALQIQNEVYTISLLVSFLLDAPQLVVQIYIWTLSSNISLWISTSIIVSLSSMTWAVVTNARHTLKIMPQKQLPTVPALVVEILWRSGFLISRIAVLVLCALCIKSWLFGFLGLHWLGMMVWLSVQKMHLWIKSWQECAQSCLMGIVNCFDYIQLRKTDRSWFKTWSFYGIMLTENTVLLTLYFINRKNTSSDSDILMFYPTTIVGGMILGLINMLIYHWLFKSTNNTILCIFVNPKDADTHRNSDVKNSFSLQDTKEFSQSITDSITADKKSLLNNIVQSTDSMEKGIINRSFVDAESDNSECKVTSQNEESSSFSSLQRQKRRGICSSLEVDLEKNEVKLDDLDINLSLHKRRGICSLMQLCEETTDLDVKKHEQVLLGESILPVQTEINTTESVENKSEIKLADSVEKLIETRSYVSSIHDYENVCPVGVARPPWCIRSWKGYTDIETYIHDDSVVRDRRRDTLTSTATATTLSSEYSDATYTSFPFRRFLRRNRQDDYLDTLAYDLVDFETNSESKFFREESSEPTLFAAKPVVIDDRGGMLSLDTIVEEHEESPKKPTNSLVATIDKIRTQMAENSPRHIYYHRNESQWEDLESRVALNRRRTSLATVLLDNKYQEMSLSSRYNPWPFGETYSPSASFADCYNELDIIKKIYSHDKQTIPLIDAVLSDSPILGSRTDIKEVILKESQNISELCSEAKEDNVYMDMSGNKMKKQDDMYESLKAMIAQTEVSQDKFHLDSLALKKNPSQVDIPEKNSEMSFSASSKETILAIEKQQFFARNKRKLPLLNEPKSQPTKNHWSKTESKEGGISIILSEQSKFDSAIAQDKVSKRKDPFSVSGKDGLEGKRKVDDKVGGKDLVDVKEKRSIFLKQILTSPKIHGWSKKRTFSPNAKIPQNS